MLLRISSHLLWCLVLVIVIFVGTSFFVGTPTVVSVSFPEAAAASAKPPPPKSYKSTKPSSKRPTTKKPDKGVRGLSQPAPKSGKHGVSQAGKGNTTTKGKSAESSARQSTKKETVLSKLKKKSENLRVLGLYGVNLAGRSYNSGRKLLENNGFHLERTTKTGRKVFLNGKTGTIVTYDSGKALGAGQKPHWTIQDKAGQFFDRSGRPVEGPHPPMGGKHIPGA